MATSKGKMDHVLIKGDERVTLEDLPAGSLFLYGDMVGFKSNYSPIESYVVGSGEFFWVGKHSPVDMRNLLVLPLKLEDIKG
jgi:hypothetical protein